MCTRIIERIDQQSIIVHESQEGLINICFVISQLEFGETIDHVHTNHRKD